MPNLAGGEMLLRALADEGVKYIFGYPGGAVLHIYDAIYTQDKVTHVLVRHEQAAAHMADGYARATGKAGVVLVTSGPGATNAITGIATAFMDSIPMVVISGQVASALIGSDAFQEIDMLGISRPVVKHNFTVANPAHIPEIVKKAFYIAESGRPGPVVIDIPKDMTDPALKLPYSYPKSVSLRTYNPTTIGHSGQIKKACELIIKAHKPILYTGGGIILDKASVPLYELATLLRIPVTNTLMGLGAFPGTHEQFLGMLGMHGSHEANQAMHNSDLIIAIGARFDDRVTNNIAMFCPHATIIHVDIDPSNIGKTVRVDVPIVGPCSQVINAMIAELRPLVAEHDTTALDAWWSTINAWRQKDRFPYTTNDTLLKAQQVIKAVYDHTKGDAYVTSDVGQHQMFAAQHYIFDKPNRWINSGSLGTMGFGLPAAMGVLFADPKEAVVCITSEGSIQMCIQELSTCKQWGLPVKIINLNNQSLGMIKQWQDMQYDGRHSNSYMSSLPDFVMLTEAYQHKAIQVRTPKELQPALDKAFGEWKDELVFLDILVDPDEHVYPMQIAKSRINDMWLNKLERTE